MRSGACGEGCTATKGKLTVFATRLYYFSDINHGSLQSVVDGLASGGVRLASLPFCRCTLPEPTLGQTKTHSRVMQ